MRLEADVPLQISRVGQRVGVGRVLREHLVIEIQCGADVAAVVGLQSLVAVVAQSSCCWDCVMLPDNGWPAWADCRTWVSSKPTPNRIKRQHATTPTLRHSAMGARVLTGVLGFPTLGRFRSVLDGRRRSGLRSEGCQFRLDLGQPGAVAGPEHGVVLVREVSGLVLAVASSSERKRNSCWSVRNQRSSARPSTDCSASVMPALRPRCAHPA